MITKEKDTRNFIQEVIVYLTNGSSDALRFLQELMLSHLGYQYIIILWNLDIRGTQISNLYDNSCGRNIEKVKRTILLFAAGVISIDDIKKNLDRRYAIAFIDDSIQIDGVPEYGEKFDLSHLLWDEWCETQKKSFERRNAEYEMKSAEVE
jgi:hypothetical protein